MKLPRILSLVAAAFCLSSCITAVRVNDVLPRTDAVVAAEVRLPNTTHSRDVDSKNVPTIVSMLRQFRWSYTHGAEAGTKFEYRLVLRRADESDDYIDVMTGELVTDGFATAISPSTQQRLDALCGLSPALLSRHDEPRPKPAS